MKKILILMMMSFMCVSSSYGAKAGSVDGKMSAIKWFGEKIVGAKHYGTIGVLPGQSIVMKNGLPVSGEIKIDVNSILVQDLEKDSSDYKKLMKHLRSEDFFNVKKYPLVTMKILSSKRISSKKIQVSTDLTIKNETKPLVLDLDIKEMNGFYVGESKFSINRKIWNLKYGSGWFSRKLDKIIKDTITFEIEIFVSK